KFPPNTLTKFKGLGVLKNGNHNISSWRELGASTPVESEGKIIVSVKWKQRSKPRNSRKQLRLAGQSVQYCSMNKF
ncbi:MAG TPA: hypothetical protein VIG34_04705, partial [Xanthobacteraceae bacterium]